MASVVPSGAAFSTCSIARPPPAPGLSSTMTFWPMFLDIASATTVAMRSAVVPLPKGTTMVIDRSEAGAACNVVPIRHASRPPNAAGLNFLGIRSPKLEVSGRNLACTGGPDSGDPCGQKAREGPCDLPSRRLNRQKVLSHPSDVAWRCIFLGDINGLIGLLGVK